jgi:hypothetical protein
MTMRVHMREAIFTRDLTSFLKMNPHYVINWKDEKIVGEPDYDGGKVPKWNEVHEFEVGNDLQSAGTMMFSFLEEEELICSVELSVRKFAEKRGVPHWYECRYDGEDSGQVSIMIDYQMAEEAKEEVEA